MSFLCAPIMMMPARHIRIVFVFFGLFLGNFLEISAQNIDLDSVLEVARNLRPENLRQYHSYQARLRETCKAQVQSIPFDIWPLSGVVIPAKKDSGLAYYSEALIDAQYGDNLHYYQDVLIKREAGKLPIPNWQQLPAYDYNLLQKRIYLNEAFDRGFVSPLSEEGKKIYDFELISYQPEKELVRIEFKPRKEKYPALSGQMDLHIGKGLPMWASFNISANNQLELLDSIAISQKFQYQEGLYRAQSQTVELHLNLFGFRGYYSVEHLYESFTYRRFWEKSEFNDQVFDLQSQEFNPDTSYWQTWNRSTSAEHYLDSLEINHKKTKQFRSFGSSRLDPGEYRFYENLYRGFTRRNGNWFLDLPPIYKGLGFNPVEGAYWRGQSRWGYASENTELNMRIQGRIGTADQRFKPVIDLNWRSDVHFPLSLSIEGGTDYKQFNEEEPILPVLNTIYNLVLAQNYINLYGKDYFKIQYQGESMSGLALGLDVEYAWRYPLFNATNFNLINLDAEYETNNLGFAPNITPGGFRAHRSTKVELSLSYQFKDRYEKRYNQRFQDVLKGRQNLVVRAPKVYYDLKIGSPLFNGETDYIFQRIGIQHQFRWGNIGLSQFDISGGHFLREQEVPFVDYAHFDGVQIFFLQPVADRSARIKQFSTLPYYTYSTTKAYLELHYEHNFDGALLSNSAFSRRYKIHSLVGFNSLHILNEKAYVEVFIGFDNIFKVLRVEFASGLDNFNTLYPSLRIGFDFRYDYYQRNRR